MGLQSQWIKQVITQAKMNNMTIIGEVGTVLASLSGKQKGEIVISYDTSGGFTQWHIYAWDGISAWVDVTLPTHKHQDTATGGKYADVQQGNLKIFNHYNQLNDFALWLTVVSGTGAAANQHDNGTDVARRYQTGTTSTGYATGYRGGIVPSFALNMAVNWVWQLSATTNLFFNLGIAMEDINVAQNNNQKIGIEWCDGQATANYYVTTASGSARSSSDSTVPLSTGIDGFRMLWTTGVQASFKFDNGTTVNKSTNLPTSTPAGNNILREGIKNNNGGVANRDLRCIGIRVLGEEGQTEWVE